jgi:acid phosphatase type 7
MLSLSRRGFLAGSLTGLSTCSMLGDSSPFTSLARAEDAPFQPSTLFLTWQRDPTTTMTVQWVGTKGETSSTTVRYIESAVLAKDSKARWKRQESTDKPYPATDFKVFRAEITGLKPGTDYQFKVGRSSPTYSFRTMPAKAADTISFISGGDCGVNEHTVANNIQAARQDPMFCIIGGDLGYDNGKSVDISLAFLRNYSKHMIGRGGRLIPMITCIGNHEVDGGYNKPRKNAPFFYALFDGLFPERGFTTLDFGDYLSLILLDSGHTSAIGGEQADWLEKQLSQRKDHPHVMCVNHVPAYPSNRAMTAKEKDKKGTGEENRKYWVPHFEKYRVPVVLEHHDHTFKRTKPLLGGMANDDGVLYLGDGSWGRLRAPQSPEKLPFLAKASENYHLSLHRLQGEERFHMALDDRGRIMDVARTGQRNNGWLSSATVGAQESSNEPK